MKHAIHTKEQKIVGYDGDCLLYDPIAPQPDNDTLCEKTDRLMLYTKRDGIVFHLAKRGVLTAGWVIGIVQ